MVLESIENGEEFVAGLRSILTSLASLSDQPTVRSTSAITSEVTGALSTSPLTEGKAEATSTGHPHPTNGSRTPKPPAGVLSTKQEQPPRQAVTRNNGFESAEDSKDQGLKHITMGELRKLEVPLEVIELIDKDAVQPLKGPSQQSNGHLGQPRSFSTSGTTRTNGGLREEQHQQLKKRMEVKLTNPHLLLNHKIKTNLEEEERIRRYQKNFSYISAEVESYLTAIDDEKKVEGTMAEENQQSVENASEHHSGPSVLKREQL